MYVIYNIPTSTWFLHNRLETVYTPVWSLERHRVALVFQLAHHPSVFVTNSRVLWLIRVSVFSLADRNVALKMYLDFSMSLTRSTTEKMLIYFRCDYITDVTSHIWRRCTDFSQTTQTHSINTVQYIHHWEFSSKTRNHFIPK